MPIEYTHKEAGICFHIDITLYNDSLTKLLDNRVVALGACFYSIGSRETFYPVNYHLEMMTLSAGSIEIMPNVDEKTVFLHNPSFIFRVIKMAAITGFLFGPRCQTALEVCQSETQTKNIFFGPNNDAKFKQDISRLLNLPPERYQFAIKLLEDLQFFASLRSQFTSLYHYYKNMTEKSEIPINVLVTKKCLIDFYIGQSNTSVSDTYRENYNDFFERMGVYRLSFSLTQQDNRQTQTWSGNSTASLWHRAPTQKTVELYATHKA